MRNCRNTGIEIDFLMLIKHFSGILKFLRTQSALAGFYNFYTATLT
jgi:hypothetical protein